MGDTVIEEPFIQALEDSLDMLRKYLDRTSNPIQLKIVLNSIIRDVTEKVNAFLQNPSHTSKEKMDCLIESLPIVTSILNILPEMPELTTNRMELISLSNFLRLNLAAFSGDSSNATVMTSASLLSQLLIGEVPHLKKCPELPSLDQYQQFRDIYFSFFNSVQSTTAVYEVLIDSIDTIGKDSLVSWINEAIWSNSLMLKHFKNYPLKEILELKKIKNWKIFYSNIFTMTAQIANIPYLIHEVLKKFQGDWPLEIDPQDLIRSTTPEGLIEFISEIKDLLLQWKTTIKVAYQNKLIPINDPIEDHEDFSSFQESLDVLTNLKDEILTFDIKQRSIDRKHLLRFINSSYELIDFLIEYAGGVEQVVGSYYVEQVMSYISYLIPFASYASVIEGSSTLFEDLLFKYKRIVDVMTLESEPTFHFNKILARIYIASKLGESIDFEEMIFELEGLIDHLVLKPRMMLMAAILLSILYGITNQESRIDPLLQDIINTVFFEESQRHIREEFLEYSTLLKNCLMGKSVSFNAFYHRLKYVPYDIFSVLLPDFTRWFPDRPVPVYVPFNRIVDSVLPQS